MEHQAIQDLQEIQELMDPKENQANHVPSVIAPQDPLESQELQD